MHIIVFRSVLIMDLTTTQDSNYGTTEIEDSNYTTEIEDRYYDTAQYDWVTTGYTGTSYTGIDLQVTAYR